MTAKPYFPMSLPIYVNVFLPLSPSVSLRGTALNGRSSKRNDKHVRQLKLHQSFAAAAVFYSAGVIDKTGLDRREPT